MTELDAQPVLSANLYASHRLDSLLSSAVAPWWRSISVNLEQAGLWWMRYGRGGEHLKLRLHAAPEVPTDALFADLKVAANSAFTSWPQLEVARRGNVTSPPIDVEDEDDVEHPDRSVLETCYRRNHVFFAGGPWLEDARIASLSVTAMACSAECVFAATGDLEASEEWPHRIRQNALFHIVGSALEAIEGSAESRAAYHAYHRDWLLRTMARGFEEGGAERVSKLRGNMEGLAAGKMARAVGSLADKFLPSMAAGPTSPLDGAWRDSVLALVNHGRELARNESVFETADEFAAEPAHLPVFKALHGVANQLGLAMRDEALAHQLLLAATCRRAGI